MCKNFHTAKNRALMDQALFVAGVAHEEKLIGTFPIYITSLCKGQNLRSSLHTYFCTKWKELKPESQTRGEISFVGAEDLKIHTVAFWLVKYENEIQL